MVGDPEEIDVKNLTYGDQYFGDVKTLIGGERILHSANTPAYTVLSPAQVAWHDDGTKVVRAQVQWLDGSISWREWLIDTKIIVRRAQ
jgi:hypothetical protein